LLSIYSSLGIKVLIQVYPKHLAKAETKLIPTFRTPAALSFKKFKKNGYKFLAKKS
jgi:hypothetical protein